MHQTKWFVPSQDALSCWVSQYRWLSMDCLVTWHRFLQSTSISGLFLLGRSVSCLSLIIPSGVCAWGTEVSCSLCAQRNAVVTTLFSQLWLFGCTGRCLLAAALPRVALHVTLEKSLPLQFYRESLLCCSSLWSHNLFFLTHCFIGLS